MSVGAIVLGLVAWLLFRQFRTPTGDFAKSKVGQLGEQSLPASEKSIAVLPFENLSSDKENAYFADGIQDEILTDLAKIADLKVISRTSVMHIRADLHVICARLVKS